MFKKLIGDCKNICAKNPPLLAFACAQDVRVLQTARSLKDEGLADPILIGNQTAIRELAETQHIPLRGIKIRQPKHDAQFDHLARRLYDQRKRKGLTRFQAEQLLNHPLWYAASFAQRGLCHVTLAGNAATMVELAEAIINMIGSQRAEDFISSFYLLVSPDENTMLAFADGCIIPRPTPRQLAGIAGSTARAFTRLTGVEARVAMLSFSTMGSARHERTETVREGVKIARQLYPGIAVDGELQFDAAFVPQVAKSKAPQSAVAGQANVFVFPSLNAANIGYKIARDLAGWKVYGPFFNNVDDRLHGLQPDADAETIYRSALLAACLSKKKDSTPKVTHT